MKERPTYRQLKQTANKFCRCRNIADVERLLKIRRNQLSVLAMEPFYIKFEVKKSDGSFRKIEAPGPQLKRTQKMLGYFLQCVYSLDKPKASYGYVMSYKKERRKRTIVSNARSHLNSRYMLNVDFEDFFHQISRDKISDIMQHDPFQFEKTSANVLAKLCCYNDRLPMGAPTSPSLSNFAAFGLDLELQQWASDTDHNYTRFVDDLTISSLQKGITASHQKEMEEICRNHNFRLNREKTKLYGPDDRKVVTGLVVDDEVTLPGEYFNELDKDIARLKNVIEVDVLTGRLPKADMIKNFKQQVSGKVNFISTVMGKKDDAYREYFNQFNRVLEPPEEALSARWANFNYF